MNFEQQNIIYLQVMKHFGDLNSLLAYNNSNIEPKKFTDCLNKRLIDLETGNLTIYLSSLLLFVFNLKISIWSKALEISSLFAKIFSLISVPFIYYLSFYVFNSVPFIEHSK